MATWTLTAQGANGSGTLTVNATDRIWFTSGTAITDNIVVSSYNDGTHITDNADSHIAGCTTMTHVNNLKYLSSTTVSINGAGGVTLSGSVPTNAQMPFKFNFSDGASVATSNGKFYAYDGATDATAMVGVTFHAFEKGDTAWDDPGGGESNGSANALDLANQAAATSHDFYIGASISPTSTGAKTGAVKISLTYV